MTLGEIIYMENAAQEREQIMWACAAQSPEMLPKKKISAKRSKQLAGEAIKAKVSPIFERYYQQYGKPPQKE